MDTPSLEVSIRGVSWFFQQVVDKIVAQRMQRRTDAYAAMALVVSSIRDHVPVLRGPLRSRIRASDG